MTRGRLCQSAADEREEEARRAGESAADEHEEKARRRVGFASPPPTSTRRWRDVGRASSVRRRRARGGGFCTYYQGDVVASADAVGRPQPTSSTPGD